MLSLKNNPDVKSRGSDRSVGEKRICVAVHDGDFHADDVFAVAILSFYLNKPLKIFRTRDEKILSKMDYNLDVGRFYNPKERKFDHHQEGWSEKRANGILYATSGLVWKEFGAKITGNVDVAQKIDEKIIQTIDAEDNGIEIAKSIFENVMPFCVSDYVYDLNPTWTEKNLDSLKLFLDAVEEAKKILKREIKKAQDCVLGAKKIKEIYTKTENKRILILDDNYAWKKIVSLLPETLFVIQETKENKSWRIKSVGLNGSQFKYKIYFPESWAGKSGETLAKISGISDAAFCHNGRFMAVAKSKEGAIKLAKLAIELGTQSN